jgi:muramoyltetrapeptide carboxypeptidase
MGRHVYGQQRTVETCLQDLQWALTDPEIRAIFCVRGGYGSTEVMDVLPAELIAAANKPIIGYSDITVYHAAWNAAGLPSIHAGMSAAFGDLPEDCAEAELHMMNGALPVYQCHANAYCREGTAEGILIGGNLSTFTATLDTAYDSTVPAQPYILFFEETGENMQHIHRYLTILKHKGILDNAAGIVFGEWTGLPADGLGNYGATRGGPFASTADMISRQFVDGMDIPVAFGFPAGHGKINYPLLMGAAAKIEVSEDSYTLSWPAAAGK